MMKHSECLRSPSKHRETENDSKHFQRWTETKTSSIQVKTDILCQIAVSYKIHGERPISLPKLDTFRFMRDVNRYFPQLEVYPLPTWKFPTVSFK